MPRARISRGLGIAIALTLSAAVCAQGDPQRVVWITATTDRNPTVSPDGNKLIFQSDRSGRHALYMSSATGENIAVFLDSGDEPRYADWSPKGEQVVFAADVGGEDDIFVINVDGTGRQRLDDAPRKRRSPAVEPGWQSNFLQL